MTCDSCGKNPATVHLTEIVNDKMAEMHLCEECAQKKGAVMQQHFGISDLLAGLADIGAQMEKDEAISSLRCPNCGMRYNDFRKIGRLGCSQCYDTFRQNLAPLIKRIHGSAHHIGKAPIRKKRAAKAKSELLRLKEKLQDAIKKEEFEEAARLRDMIRAVERRQGEGGAGRRAR